MLWSESIRMDRAELIQFIARNCPGKEIESLNALQSGFQSGFQIQLDSGCYLSPKGGGWYKLHGYGDDRPS
jgi:hypothetical protein